MKAVNLSLRSTIYSWSRLDTSTEFEGGAEDEQQRDYSGLMDRFRSRLIIPIFDESGQSVIALGGRQLEVATDGSDDKSSSFTPTKYLNSSDSRVYEEVCAL
jgi:DNA primase